MSDTAIPGTGGGQIRPQEADRQWRLKQVVGRPTIGPMDARGGGDGRGGMLARPVARPDDLDDPSIVKATGVVQLPDHVRWSGLPKKYDLDDRRDRARVYEQVLREGTEDDVRHYVVLDELLSLWDDLVLPASVRDAWADWVRQQLDSRC